MKGCLSIYSLWKKKAKPGFFLLELQISLFLTLMLLSLLACTIRLGWNSWNKLATESELRDCSRYIFSRLEKDVGIGASCVHIKRKNPAIMELQLLESKHVIRIYSEKNRIYRKVLTRSGSGVNPLYINEVLVEDWQVQPVNSKALLISYVLRRNQHKQYFQQLVFCHNGLVQDDEGY